MRSSPVFGRFTKVFRLLPNDVAMMMALLKVARIKSGGGTVDSFVDLAGYAACGGELVTEVPAKCAQEADSNLLDGVLVG